MVMRAGIGIAQAALPPLVRQWLPHHVSRGTAIYTNGLLMGETLPVMFTIPLVLPFVDGSWRWALVFWGVPLVFIAILTVALAPAAKEPATVASAARHDWWPDWRNPLTWQIGVLLGSVNGVYFASNAFLPRYLTEAGRPDLLTAAVTAPHFGQLPHAFLLLAPAERFLGRAQPLVRFAVLVLPVFAGVGIHAYSWCRPMA